jgi:hypothetical protein
MTFLFSDLFFFTSKRLQRLGIVESNLFNVLFLKFGIKRILYYVFLLWLPIKRTPQSNNKVLYLLGFLKDSAATTVMETDNFFLFTNDDDLQFFR